MGWSPLPGLFRTLHPKRNNSGGSKTSQRRAEGCKEESALSTPARLQSEIKNWNVGVDPRPIDVDRSISIDVSRLWIEPSVS